MNYFSFRKYMNNNTTRLDGLTAGNADINTGTFIYLTSKTPTVLGAAVEAGPEIYLVAEDYTAGETEIVVYDVKEHDFYIGFGQTSTSTVTYSLLGGAGAAVVADGVKVGGQHSITVSSVPAMQIVGKGTTNKHVEVVAVLDTPYTFTAVVDGRSDGAGDVVTSTYKQVVFKFVRG